MLKKIFIGINFIVIFFCIFYFYKSSFFKKKRILNALIWAGDLDISIINEFESKTGIKLNVSYFSTNEELLSKINFTNGKGIDLIMPSEYTLYNLYDKEMLIPIDKNKIVNYEKFYKIFLKDAIINDVLYAIPFEINFYGLAIKNNILNKFSDRDELFHAFFNHGEKNKNLKICMTNDIATIVNLVKNYYENYFKNKIADSNAFFTIIYEILKKQKKNVLVYADTRVSHILMNGDVDFAYIQTHEYIKALQKIPDLRFILFPFAPIKSVEYFAISKKSENIDEAYEFINFLTKPENLAKNYKYSFSPVTMDISDYEEYPSDVKEIIENNLNGKIKSLKIEEYLNEEDKARLMMLLKSY